MEAGHELARYCPALHRSPSPIHAYTREAWRVRHWLAVPHTVSVRLVHARIALAPPASVLQMVHVAHTPADVPAHPLARYRPAVHWVQDLQLVPMYASW